jgi:phage I-like protein
MTPEEIKKLIDTAMAAVTAKIDSLSAALEKMVGDKGVITELSSGLETLRKQGEEQERNRLISQANSEGKVVPAEVAKTLSLAQLTTLCSELPVTVPLHERTPAILPLSADKGSPEKGFNPEVAKAFGLSKEAYLAAQA